MKAFNIKYLAPTDTLPARLKVSCYRNPPRTYNYPVWEEELNPYSTVVLRYVEDTGIEGHKDLKLAIGQIDETSLVGVFHE